MNSAKSFFPTRADIPSHTSYHHKLYNICKQAQNENSSYRTLEPTSTSNIFKQTDFDEYNKQIDRPVGGQQLFKRMDLIAQQKFEGKRLRRTNKQFCQRNVYTSTSSNHPNQRLKRAITENGDSTINNLQIISHKINKTEIGEQLFKSHNTYKTIYAQSRSKVGIKIKREAKSLHTIQPKFSSLKDASKIDKQIKQHHDKMALLGQIDRSRPLIQLCGDSYFEMILRNRFEQDLKLPNYIYRVKDKFSDNKVISRLRAYKPNILQRKHLFLVGKKKQNEKQ